MPYSRNKSASKQKRIGRGFDTETLRVDGFARSGTPDERLENIVVIFWRAARDKTGNLWRVNIIFLFVSSRARASFSPPPRE